MEILRVENLCKIYGKGENEVRAVDNISFKVNKGEFVAICESRSLSHFVIDPKYKVSKKIIKTLAEATKDFDGLQIDFELVPKRDAENFKIFLKKLKKAIGKDKMLSVCVPARTKTVQDDVYDYKELSSCADRIFIMASGLPCATITPPLRPPSGPRSMR